MKKGQTRRRPNYEVNLTNVCVKSSIGGVIVGLLLAIIILLYNLDWYIPAMIAEGVSIILGVVLGRPIYNYMLYRRCKKQPQWIKNSMLYDAVLADDYKSARIALKAGADPDATRGMARVPMHMLVNSAAIKRLLQKYSERKNNGKA